MLLISDKKLVQIPIKDNREKMVSIENSCPKIIIRLGGYIKKEGKKVCDQSKFISEGVAKRLNLAQSYLPKGHKLMIRCGYRPLKLQKKIYDKIFNKFLKFHPNWSKKKIREETSKQVAPIDIVPPHSTGGTVDLTIIGPNGKQLKMGTKLNQFNEKTYTFSNKLSKIEKKNRNLLIKVMKKAGFINYPTEWWHWSYGDRYWAAVKKKKYSIYKGL